jgi:hypothetical protein
MHLCLYFLAALSAIPLLWALPKNVYRPLPYSGIKSLEDSTFPTHDGVEVVENSDFGKVRNGTMRLVASEPIPDTEPDVNITVTPPERPRSAPPRAANFGKTVKREVEIAMLTNG